MRLLLVEDDHSLASALEKALSHEGFTIDSVNTGEGALFIVDQAPIDAVILDIGLPDLDGLTVLRRIRKQHPVLPVLLLTARDSIEDKVSGLDGGADDYLTKPFDMPELIARLRAISRRIAGRGDNRITIGEVVLDPTANTVTVGGERIDLGGREYTLLFTLMENQGRLLSREQLESKLYAWGEQLSSNAVEVYIHNLRKKLGKTFIKTVRGIGYGVGL